MWVECAGNCLQVPTPESQLLPRKCPFQEVHTTQRRRSKSITRVLRMKHRWTTNFLKIADRLRIGRPRLLHLRILISPVNGATLLGRLGQGNVIVPSITFLAVFPISADAYGRSQGMNFGSGFADQIAETAGLWLEARSTSLRIRDPASHTAK